MTFGSINNNSGSGANGYENFTNQQTSVFAGQSYSISIGSAAAQEQNFGAWIDFNNNETFDPTNEQVLFEEDVLGSTTATIAIPAWAVTGVPLRLRIYADWNAQPDPEPCLDPMMGQVEDYTVLVSQDTTPPTAAIAAAETVVCDGIVEFTDASNGIATGWYWDFGDGNTSTLANPTHTYDSSGTFTVLLISSNVFGADTVVENNLITVNLDGMVTAAACTPNTLAHCCEYGITTVSFAGINNNSAGGEEDYQDFSCEHQATVTEGSAYTFWVVTGPTELEDVSVWIDYNNDGHLNDTTELVMFSTNQSTHTQSVSIPGGAVLNTPVRIRVMSDFVGSPMTSCGSPQWGQAEDYSVVIEPNMDPPLAGFESNKQSTCDGEIEFTDMSTGFPSSWSWNFGDGMTSTDQNPVHDYQTTGLFTVSLTTSNSFGSDTETKTNYISVESTLGGPVVNNCTPQTQTYCCGVGIYNVQIGDIDHTTADGIEGYQDYSCQQLTELGAGLVHPVFVQTGFGLPETVVIWIDYDNNGVFNQTNEQVFVSETSNVSHIGTFYIPDQDVTGQVPLRMRIHSDWADGGGLPGPCDASEYGQVEDYSVVLTGEIGIEQLPLDQTISVYPSPTRGTTFVNIDLPRTETVQLTVYNTVGQLITTEQLAGASFYQHQLDFTGKPKGMYFLEVRTATEKAIKKIVVH